MLSTATVEDAAQANIVLTFDDIIVSVDGLTLGGDADPAKIISGIAIASNVVTITVSVDYDNGDTITIATGNFRSNKNNYLALAAEAVTNNVA